MPTDFSKYGTQATNTAPTGGTDFSKYGVTQNQEVQPPTTAQRMSFLQESIAPYSARQTEAANRFVAGEQGPLPFAIESIANTIGAGLSPIFTGISRLDKATGGVGSKIVEKSILGDIGKGVNQTANRLSDLAWFQKFAESNLGRTTAQLAEAVPEFLNIVPLPPAAKATSRVIDYSGEYLAQQALRREEVQRAREVVAHANKVDERLTKLNDFTNSGVKTKNLNTQIQTQKGYNPNEIIAANDRYVPAIVDGKVVPDEAIAQVRADQQEMAKIVSAAISADNAYVPVSRWEALAKSLIEENKLEGAKHDRILKNIEADFEAFRRNFSNTADEVPTTLIDSVKKKKYENINWNDPDLMTADRAIAKAARQLIEDSIPDSPIKEMNRELGKLYDVQDTLEAMQGRAIKGGRLGKYFARGAGAIFGTAIGGPAGGIVGGIAADKLADIMQSQYFKTPSVANAVNEIRTTRPQVFDEALRIIEQRKAEQATRPLLPSGNPSQIPIPLGGEVMGNPVNAAGERVPVQSNLSPATQQTTANAKNAVSTNIKRSLQQADKKVKAKAGTPINKEIRSLEEEIAQNVEAQKRAIKAGNFDVVEKLKELYDILVAKLKSAIEKVKNTPNKQGGFANLGADVVKKDSLDPRNFKTPEEFVKAQGTPLYHGSPFKFDKFSTKNVGIRDAGEGGMLGDGIYATAYKGKQGGARMYGENVTEVYFDLKNPFVIDDVYMFGGIHPDKIRLKIGLPTSATSKQVQEKLISMGHDGVVLNQKTDKGLRKNVEVVAFSPDQIKTRSQLTDIWKKANVDNSSQDILYHGGRNIGDKGILSFGNQGSIGSGADSGAIFLTPSKKYASGYVKSDGALYKANINISKEKIFDATNELDMKKLESVIGKQSAKMIKDSIEHGAADWATLSQYVDEINKLGYSGAKFLERPAENITPLADGSFKLEGNPVYSYGMFKEIPVTKVVEPIPGTNLYHSTDKQFAEFDPEKGHVWFTDSKEAIKKSGVGASGKGFIVERKLPSGLKFATPEQADSLFTDQLIADGYDGVFYPGKESEGTGNFYQIFDAKKFEELAKKEGK